MKYHSKIVEIEAIRFMGPYSLDEMQEAWGADFKLAAEFTYGPILDLKIKTLEGTMQAVIGDWIIKGTHDEFYPCKHHVFETKYEPA